MSELGASFEERFWRKVGISTPDQCWHWTAFVNPAGYGMVGAGLHLGGPKIWLSHRVAYTIAVGPIPEGLTLDHACHTADLECLPGDGCRHRRCVNPGHLEPVTQAVNAQRGAARVLTCIHGHPKGPDSHTPEGACRACKVERNRARGKVA